MRLMTYYTTVATIFLLIGILHAARFILRWEAIIAGYTIPIWFSLGAAVIAFYLSGRGFYFRSLCE
jgi:hypothetical protein